MSLNFQRSVCITITLTVLLLPLTSVGLYAQDTVLQGSVINEEGDPVPFASILLLTAEDSVQTHWTVTNQRGRYRLGSVAANTYVVRVSMVGYATDHSLFSGFDARQPKVVLPPVTLTGNRHRPRVIEGQVSHSKESHEL